MEEYCLPHPTSPRQQISTNQSNATDIPHSKVKTRQLSILSIQLQKNVSIFQKNQFSTRDQLLNIESFSLEIIFKKVYSLLRSLITDPKLHHELTQIFRVAKDDKNASSLSPSSDSSSSSSINSSNVSQQDLLLKNVGSRHRALLKQIGLNSSMRNKKEQQLVKVRGSMMRKSNRISIADGIRMNELQDCLKDIVALPEINSSCSVEEQDKLFEFKTKKQLKFQSQSSVNCDKQKENRNEALPVAKQKKISIMFMMQQYNSSSNNDSFFSEVSEQKAFSLSELAPENSEFSLEAVKNILDSSQAFLINLTISLLLKCVACAQLNLTDQNASWMLSIAYIVACKVYYDQPLQGIVDYFSEILGVTRSNVIHLEKWFLQQLNYQVSISCSQYQQIMLYLINEQE